jgi:acyl-CoA synthetase (AMP-forming)/AMP-acid ligase II
MHVGHLLSRAAQRYPDRPAWVEGDVTITFRDAEARVNRLAHALVALGGQRGDRVAMLIPNRHEGLETILAPMKAGMAVVPMNVRLHPTEHAYMIQDSGASILVYSGEFREHLAPVRDTLSGVRHFVCVGPEGPGDLGYDELMQDQRDTHRRPASSRTISPGSSIRRAPRGTRRARCSATAISSRWSTRSCSTSIQRFPRSCASVTGRDRPGACNEPQGGS